MLEPDVNCSEPHRSFEPDTLPYYFAQYVLPAICIFGLIGNSLNIIILRRLKSNTNFFLLITAIADLFFYIPVFLSRMVVYDRLALSEDFVRIHVPANIPLVSIANWFSSISIWFALMITFERLIVIRTPFKASTLWNRQKLTIIVLLICLLAAILRIPDYFWYFVSAKPNCFDPTKTVYIVKTLPTTANYYQLIQTMHILSFLFIIVNPLFVLISFNILLLYYLKRNNKNLVQLGWSTKVFSHTEKTVTKRVLFIVITFFVLNFPAVVIGVWVSLIEADDVIFPIIADVPLFISDILVIMSKAINFPLYCFVSPSFRKQLKLLFTFVRKYELV